MQNSIDSFLFEPGLKHLLERVLNHLGDFVFILGTHALYADGKKGIFELGFKA